MHCLQHTRVSPHGPRGGCGLESKCVCSSCFGELAPAQQAAYDRINRLLKPGAGAGISGSARSSTMNHGSQAAAGCSCDAELQQAEAVPAEAAGDAACEQGSSPLGTPPGSGRVSPQQPSPAASPAAAAALHRSPSTKAAAGTAARKRWKKAGGVLRALVRFKAAGSKPSSPQQAL